MAQCIAEVLKRNSFAITYKSTINGSGQVAYARAAVKWVSDYLLKAHTASGELYGQVRSKLIKTKKGTNILPRTVRNSEQRNHVVICLANRLTSNSVLCNGLQRASAVGQIHAIGQHLFYCAFKANPQR